MSLRTLFIIGLWFWAGFAPAVVGQVASTGAGWHSALTREVYGEVAIRKASKENPARPGVTIGKEDRLRTGGGGAMVAILFDDQRTLARLGALSFFTFSATNVNVPEGLALVCVKDGKELVCEACSLHMTFTSTAVVESFTWTNQATRAHRCATKVILLEGHAKVSTPGGRQFKTLRGGQMILQFGDDPLLADIQEVDVKRVMKESRIITGFKERLPSIDKIQVVIDRQQRELWRGGLETTGFAIAGRGPDRYQQPPWARLGSDVIFDPDIVHPPVPPCPVCP